jgi:hypothetical protein
MYYTPINANLKPMPDRKGHQFGPFVVVRNLEGEWQLDHWPTGSKILPNHMQPTQFGYNRLRQIASRLKTSTAFRTITLANYADGTWPRAEAKADLLAAINQTEPQQ